MKFILSILICISLLTAADIQEQFNIEKISIKVYDNNLNRIVDKPLNVYGNDMNLFLAVKISQQSNEIKKYKLEISGYGKGRENDAEGLVEDYQVNISKNITLYYKEALFVPFILKYPCTNEEEFIVKLINEEGKQVSKKVINKLTKCYLN